MFGDTGTWERTGADTVTATIPKIRYELIPDNGKIQMHSYHLTIRDIPIHNRHEEIAAVTRLQSLIKYIIVKCRNTDKQRKFELTKLDGFTICCGDVCAYLLKEVFN